ncbi:hypothetical protein JX265_012577 [Neoarthrinium moseri]|uniref:Aba 3 protein n=1 Tax=Neoarthrinium moseri TaxID=1658444 RepID=A0A9Q0AIE4_9PEZI|nr:hypothetical protein JX265_012577 [Neoarthrinium moseri]
MTTATESRDAWYYPPDVAHDLDGDTHLAEAQKKEIIACAYEYTRCVIPHYTNWKRYVGFVRCMIIGIIAECRGDLIDENGGDNIFGYSLDGVLAELFEGTPGHALMAREYKSFLIPAADKSSQRRNGELFRRYVNALASSPRTWFRMRDCDALSRFTIFSALACNDIDTVPTDDECELLSEVGIYLYDAVAFYKHRSEGETNNTFAYVPWDMRIESFRVAREILWALDAYYVRRPEGPILINFVRIVGGPVHMMMRRYRFVEEECTIGRVETDDIIELARRKVKLWNRVDVATPLLENEKSVLSETPGVERYRNLLARGEEWMFPGLPEYLERGGQCERCVHRSSYGSEIRHTFGGVRLCQECSETFRAYVGKLPERVRAVYPEIILKTPSQQIIDKKDINTSPQGI